MDKIAALFITFGIGFSYEMNSNGQLIESTEFPMKIYAHEGKFKFEYFDEYFQAEMDPRGLSLIIERIQITFVRETT